MRQVVLLSGGIDSVVCAELARRHAQLTACVHVNYGQPSRAEEQRASVAYCTRHGIPLHVVQVSGVELADMGDGARHYVVPHRNALLLTMAANIAGAKSADTLTIGAIQADQEHYEDCRPPFFERLSSTLGLHVHAPLVNLTKREVLGLARTLSVDLSATWSCYAPGPEPCTTCPSCRSAMDAAEERT